MIRCNKTHRLSLLIALLKAVALRILTASN